MNTHPPTHLDSSAPKAVKATIFLLGFAFLMAIIALAHRMIQSKGGMPIGYFIFLLLTAGVVGSILYCWILKELYQRKKWALWMMYLGAIFIMISLPFSLQNSPQVVPLWEKVLYGTPEFLQLSSAILLLLPSSRRWFYPANHS
ncbi:MAG: hypothetical protein QM627_07590 [Luteolibacter sp.]